MKVIITGASGFLGSAVRNAFTTSPYTKESTELLNLSFSQSGEGLTKLDLTNQEHVESLFQEFKPDWVIHCAAERRPDVAEKNPDAASQLNVGVPALLASLAKKMGYTLIYVSTDYVFDGTSPPYTPSAKTNPLNFYGQTKRDGELAVLGADAPKVVVLRVPVLYGPCKNNSDSAVNILVDIVKDQSGKTYKMDHYATRYPTNTVDIGNFLARLSVYNKPIPLIIHYSAAEPYTKYEMCLVFAKLLSLPHSHIVPDAEPPAAGGAARPKDCQLYTGETENLNVEGGLGTSGFEEWWGEYLKK